MDSPGLRIGPLIPEQDYERLEDGDPEGSQDSPLHGEEQQPLLHVPEGLRSSWHHIQNLDSFFTKIYSYHQRNGFTCILLEDVFQLGQFIFIVTFTTFLLRCVDYSVLFANQPSNRTGPGPLHSKVTLSDAVLPSSQCAQRICSSPLLVFLLILAAAFWLFQLLRSVCNLFSYWDIQVFYREALHIPPEATLWAPSLSLATLGSLLFLLVSLHLPLYLFSKAQHKGYLRQSTSLAPLRSPEPCPPVQQRGEVLRKPP